MPSDAAPADDYRLALKKAIKLLARREHSRHELEHKLRHREYAANTVQAVLAECESLGYLNDERFAVLFARQRIERAEGPLSIRSRLQARGIDMAQIERALEALDVPWSDLAVVALRGRFTEQELADGSQRQRGRVARFLAGRGFSSGDALRALQRVSAATPSDVD